MIIRGKDSKDYEVSLKRSSGEETSTCPACSHLRKKKTVKCFTWNHDKKLGLCAHCGLAYYSPEAMEENKIEKVTYKIPVKNLTKLSDKALEWFKSRGISQNTVMSFDITESSEFMPQVSESRNCINFNYYRDGKLVNVKFRDGQKNFKLVSGAELIFYNYDRAKQYKTLVICEGEVDCLSLFESGVYECVSVPDGAKTSENAKLEYLNSCYDLVQTAEHIILAVDNDEAGLKFREILANRIGKDKCLYVTWPDGCKDANDVLQKFGHDIVAHCIETAKPFPLDGIQTVSDVRTMVDDIYMNGYPKTEGIGFTGFDQLLRFASGQLTVVTGIPGSGKSEFIDQIMIKLSDKHGWKHGVFSAENQPVQLHIAKLIEKHSGGSMTGYNKLALPNYMDSLQFVNEFFYFIKITEENLRIEGILTRAKELITRYGIRMLVIDNWANLEHSYSGETEHQYIGKSLIKIFNFCKAHDIHVVVVAHPTKIKKVNGKYEVATMYDISGSSHWFNKPDNGISVYRDFETGTTTVYVQKVRFKFNGKIGMQDFEWDKICGRYNEV